jgi:hypothetical protein
VTDDLVIDLRDKDNPPPDDPEKAPNGWVWDRNNRRGGGWQPRMRNRRGSGSLFGVKKDTPDPDVENKVQEVLEERGFQDPGPAYASVPPRKTRKTRLSAPKVTAKVKGDMSAAVGMFVMAAGPAVMSRDPYCGSALLDNSQKITEAVIPLLCRSHTVVAFFSDSSENGWLLWFNLAIALAPVGQAVAQHHILRTVEIREDPETGDLYAGPRDLGEFPVDDNGVVSAPAG